MPSKHLIPLVDQFLANKLPTKLEALGYFLWLESQKSNHLTWHQSAVLTVRSIITLWDKAYIKTRDKKMSCGFFFIVKAALYSGK